MLVYFCLGLFVSLALAQLTQEELAPLLSGLAAGHANNVEKRVPLMTNDSTVVPLIELQMFAPPVVPDSQKCQIEMLRHQFGDGSFNVPAVVDYTPPTDCGEAGKWAAISLNVTTYCNGTQYDRLASLYLNHAEIMRTSSAEPTKTGTIWTTLKDVTHFNALFKQPGEFMMDFSNIIDPSLLLDGVFDATVTATFYTPSDSFAAPNSTDIVIPLSNLSPNVANLFTIDNDAGATINISLPETATEAFIEVFSSGNSAEEFWYLNTPDEFLGAFPEETGLIGKGPFREVQVLIDGLLAGVVWPYAVIYTGGITPSNWRPLTSFGAFDSPTYWIDATPFIPILVDQSTSHNVTLRVVGQGVNPSINSNWFVSGSLHVRNSTSKTTGKMTTYEVPEPDIQTTGGSDDGNVTVWTKVTASRNVKIESEVENGGKTSTVSFTQQLTYQNDGRYADEGWIQWGNQTTTGTVEGVHNGAKILRDAFEYPIRVFSNYSLFTAEFGAYGSDIHQSHIRALQSPTDTYKSIMSVQHAIGEIGMDNWPGLRHAINGTGSTEQTFAYVDGRGQSYFRDSSAKNDGWVKDRVWGTLRDQNPPVPESQLFPNGSGPGFRRMVSRRNL